MLKTKLFYIFLFVHLVIHSQELEEEIYTTAETFIENQNQESFEVLSRKSKQFESQISSSDEQLAFVFLLCNKAYYLKEINNSIAAITAYEDAWKRYSENGLSGYDIIDFCLKPLGRLYTVSKDYSNAESTIHQYLFLAEKKGDKDQIIAGFINLSIVHQMAGEHQKVIRIVSNALATLSPNAIQKQKLVNIQIDSQFVLGQISEAKDIPKSKSYNYFLNRTELDLKNGAFQKAETNFEKGEKLFFKQNGVTARMLAKHYLKKSELFLKVGKKDKALNSLSKALQTLLPNFKGERLLSREDLYKENTFIDIFDLYGDLQSDVEQALEYYDLSFYMADFLSENISSQETKIINQINDRIRSEKCIELLFERYEKTKDRKFLTRAFQYAENSKAAVLKEMLQKKSLLQLYPNDGNLKKEQLLLQEQEFLINEMVKEQMGKKRVAVLNNLWIDQTKNAFKLKAVKKEISKKYPIIERPQLSINDLQEHLMKDKATLVEYFYGKRAMYQFAIDADDAFFFKIELNDELKKDVSSFIRFFDDASAINNNVKKYTAQAFKTYHSLQLNPFSSAENLLIIPDGLLNFIPFEALLTENTETTSFSKMPFLLKRQKLVYNSSAEFYLKDYKTNSGLELLGVFPVFENTNQQLKYSIDEARAIEKEINSKLLMNENATKNNFITNIANYGILHLSTHASSGDFIVPASIDFYDAKLTLNELYSLDLNPELVVLSACETGVGELQKGEGAMSIARGFQYVGAQNILFSLWKINDQSTSRIMRSFYKEYDSHSSFYTANHNSKLVYLQDEAISNSKKSPYYWSAFMYYGKLTNPIATNNYLYIIGFGVLLLVLFFGFRKFPVK